MESRGQPGPVRAVGTPEPSTGHGPCACQCPLGTEMGNCKMPSFLVLYAHAEAHQPLGLAEVGLCFCITSSFCLWCSIWLSVHGEGEPGISQCIPGSQSQGSVLCYLRILNFHQCNFLTVVVSTVSLRKALMCDSGWVTAAESVQMAPSGHKQGQHWVRVRKSSQG